MPSYSRCREKFSAAIYRLAVAEGDVRSRLLSAYRILRSLQDEEFPPQLRDEWTQLKTSITRLGPQVDQHGVAWKSGDEYTLSKIKNSTGRKIAERIYMLEKHLNHH